MEKKGSHVGMMLSFVIFITFLIWVYMILSPQIKVEKSKEDLLNYLKISLIKDLSLNVTIASIGINKDYSKPSGITCFEINDFEIGEKVIVKNKDEKKVLAKVISSSSGYNLRIDWADGNEKFFKIYYSKEFIESSAPPSSCQKLEVDKQYVIGSVATMEYLSQKNVIQLGKDYTKNKELIKEKFNFPKGSDFDFVFIIEGATLVDTTQSQTAQGVYAEEVPVQYVNENGDLDYGFLKLRVW